MKQILAVLLAFVVSAGLACLAIGLASGVLGCATVHGEHTWGYNVDSPPYAVDDRFTTPGGVHLDASGQYINPLLVDRLVREVEACVGKSLDRSAFVVKVPNDWTLTCDKKQQVLPAPGAGDLGCDAKGLAREAGCPCRWRAYDQWPNVVVTTPSFYLFKDALTRFATGSRNPWADPKLAACVAPTTDPLNVGMFESGGVGQ